MVIIGLLGLAIAILAWQYPKSPYSNQESNNQVNSLDELILIRGRSWEIDNKTVDIDSFYIGRYEVTNTQYSKFVIENDYPPPKHWNNKQPPSGKEFHPVVGVDWNDALAYAKWKGATLPHWTQWFYAAVNYPTYIGGVLPGGSKITERKISESYNIANISNKGGSTKKVGSYEESKTKEGLYDVIGNVNEMIYYLTSKNDFIQCDPGGFDGNETLILVGGSFVSRIIKDHAGSASEYGSSLSNPSVGFRIVKCI